MKSSQNRQVLFTLELNEDEASWINGLVQNPLFDNETERDGKMRELFFNATKVDVPLSSLPPGVRGEY